MDKGGKLIHLDDEIKRELIILAAWKGKDLKNYIQDVLKYIVEGKLIYKDDEKVK